MRTLLREHFHKVPPLVWLLLGTVVCLTPFLNKAFHIDDTLFLRAAAHIQKHPLDFYGFNMNWHGSTLPMIENFDNPPLACYYLALAATIGGWSETFLHLAFLVPAILALWGIYELARLLNATPWMAAAIAWTTPAFMLSATTLMCDIMLLAFWVWAVVWFERGLQGGSRAALLGSGLLAGLAFLTKFTGLALVPLLIVYGLLRERRPGWWLVSCLLPLVYVAAYEWLTFELYGKGMLLVAGEVSTDARTQTGGTLPARLIIGLVFMGGCFLPLLLFVPWLSSFRGVMLGLLLFTPLLLGLPYLGQFALLWDLDQNPNWLLCVQTAAFAASGMLVLLLGMQELLRWRDPVSILLWLWIGGIFVFATAVNWTLNARSLLPMLPAVGILAARRIASRPQSVRAASSWRFWCPLGAAAAISLLVLRADYQLAGTGRTAAREVFGAQRPAGQRLWFQGHWGFQHYMERLGATAQEEDLAAVAAGDVIVVPSEGVNLSELPIDMVRLMETVTYTPSPRLSTMNVRAGAGFYSAKAGPFSFSVGPSNPERYYVFEVIQPASACSKSNQAFQGGALRNLFEIEHQIRVWEAQARANPSDVTARLELAALAEKQQRLQEAIAAYESILTDSPSCAEALGRLSAMRANPNCPNSIDE